MLGLPDAPGAPVDGGHQQQRRETPHPQTDARRHPRPQQVRIGALPQMSKSAPTEAQKRNMSICAGLFGLTHNQPLTAESRGPPHRTFISGPLTIMATPLDDILILDAFLEGTGKVASFRLSNFDHETDRAMVECELVSLKVKTLPTWVPLLNFEMEVLRRQIQQGVYDPS